MDGECVDEGVDEGAGVGGWSADGLCMFGFVSSWGSGDQGESDSWCEDEDKDECGYEGGGEDVWYEGGEFWAENEGGGCEDEGESWCEDGSESEWYEDEESEWYEDEVECESWSGDRCECECGSDEGRVEGPCGGRGGLESCSDIRGRIAGSRRRRSEGGCRC